MGTTSRVKTRQAQILSKKVARNDRVSPLPDSPPKFIQPMQAKSVNSLPTGHQWRYKLKLDGYRAPAIKSGASVKLIPRTQTDLSGAYPEW